MLPDWLSAERLQWILLAAIALNIVAIYLVAKFVRKLITKFLLFVLLVGLGLSLWIQRDDLQDCVSTCECRLYGQDVEVPPERRPDRCAEVDD